MAALIANRSTKRRENASTESHPVGAATKIYQGAMVVLNAAGWAVPGVTATTVKPLGRAEHQADNSAGANGDINVRIRKGVLQFANSASGDLITRADIGNSAYIVDDQTVAKTSGGSTRSVAGIIRDVDAAGVWVQF